MDPIHCEHIKACLPVFRVLSPKSSLQFGQTADLLRETQVTLPRFENEGFCFFSVAFVDRAGRIEA